MNAFTFGVILLVLLLNVTAINGLECYSCATTKDWDKCNDAKKEQTCPSSYTRCLKAEVHFEGAASADTYLKGCVPPDSCTAQTLEKCKTSVPGVKVSCKVNCCDGDLCNTGVATKLSGIILLACAVLSILNNF
ncbi:lymphocyte antigen 6 complex locus protein G6d-like [Actinia tenebrosa]|uniref:Lymphocyte antigen 6 complex locus protein G6d-like n=1 Tax=Actinia tenebrosa TaxID=6105 RepID=A0A6P8ILM9_ACTTE|nr:lymphocyte antigen 6 complex locus protein G6d-like [Actinia tenebrosa]